MTERERDILDLIADGLTNRQIAERLFLAEKTVKNYVSGLLTKLDMERTQAAVYGAQVRQAQQDATERDPAPTRMGPTALIGTSGGEDCCRGHDRSGS